MDREGAGGTFPNYGKRDKQPIPLARSILAAFGACVNPSPFRCWRFASNASVDGLHSPCLERSIPCQPPLSTINLHRQLARSMRLPTISPLWPRGMRTARIGPGFPKSDPCAGIASPPFTSKTHSKDCPKPRALSSGGSTCAPCAPYRGATWLFFSAPTSAWA
jgi:hypothetical protein